MKETSLRKRSGCVLFAKLSARLTRRLESLSLNDLKGAALKELKAKMMEDSQGGGSEYMQCAERGGWEDCSKPGRCFFPLVRMRVSRGALFMAGCRQLIRTCCCTRR